MGKRNKIVVVLLVLCLLMGCNSQPAVAVVPDVTEADKDTAITLLTEQGFVPVVKEIIDPSAPVGTVLRTDPPAGAYVAVGGKVYLFVAVDGASATPLSTTAQPLSTTSVPQTSTFAPQTSTVLHQTTTTAVSTATTTPTTAQPPVVETLSLGQTWTVANQWTFTLLGVERHTLCNPVHNSAENYKNQQVITIRYTYENLGFVSRNEPFLFDATTFAVTQEDGAKVSSYACLHETRAVPCTVGESHTAEETYVVDEACRRITLQVTLRATDGQGIQRVKFDILLP